MKPFVRRTAAIAALILLTLIAGILANPPAPSAAYGGTILWKQSCPWRAEIQVRQDGNDLVVFCLQSR